MSKIESPARAPRFPRFILLVRFTDSNKNYDELLRDNKEVSIHQSHLRALICEVFKSLNPEFMWSYFVFKNITYSIRKGPLLKLPAAKFIQSMSTLEQLAPIY